MEEGNFFAGKLDRYNGVTIDSQEEPCNLELFMAKLMNSLTKWAEEHRRCIWFKVNIKDAAWVPLLSDEGFDFHHSRVGFVMMFKWLPRESVCNLPPACHTNIGVGAIVYNDKGEILAVSENHYDYPHWKLPGGYVERGEDIKDAAVREVKEETGIEAQFQYMITLRHTHNMMFGNSDIYFVVKLKAISNTIQKCDMEIKTCKWMEVDEYLNHPHVHEFNRFIIRQAIDHERRRIKLSLNDTSYTIANFSRKITALTLEDQ